MGAHLIVGEVAPLAPMLVPLGEIAACIFILGIIWVLRGFLTALLGALGHVTSIIPFIGGVTSGIVHSAERAVTAALGDAESFFDARIGAAWHELARLVDWTYKELRSHANLLYTIASLLVGPAAVGALRAGIAVLHGNVHAAQKQITSTYSRVLSLEHRLQHTITAGVLPRLGRLEREYDHVIDKDIAGLRSRTKTVEKSLDDVWKYVRTHPWTVVTDAFVGAVAVALGRLGLNWIKCESGKSLFSKRGCSLWSRLDGLIGLFAEAALVTNICTVLPFLETAFSEVASPLIGTLTEIGAGLCATGSAPPELLPTVDLHLPAAPAVTLYLP